MRSDGGVWQPQWVVHGGGEPIPPCSGAVACRAFVRENEVTRTLLWVWIRARARGRDARRRVLAWAVATELWRKPHQDAADRRAVARAKRMVSDLADEQVQRIDGALAGAFECYGHDMSTDFAWFLFQAAEQRMEAARVHLEEDTSGGGLGWFRLAPLAFGLVMTAAWYRIEVERGHAPRCWYCPGCQDWHVQAKGRPPRHHVALMELVREAGRRGGVARGDAKEVLRDVGEGRKGAMPTLRYWQKFIARHHLGPRRRRRGIRRRGRRYEFFVVPRRRVAS